MATERLFDIDAKEKKFLGTVLSCDGQDGKYTVVLDRTLFFPEEGGQSCDCGMLGGAAVSYVYEKDRVIYHECDRELSVGDTVEGEIFYGARFRKMQNHTGEHIISGIVHTLYGYDNVGFHLGEHGMTIDFNGVLDKQQLIELELLANGIVIRTLPVKTYYPEMWELEGMNYRSKLDLTENVRIVEIEGVDMCACCAPHVSNTGEVGIIKILGCMNYKGGVRLSVLCGLDAMEDYGRNVDMVQHICERVSEPHERAVEGVERLLDEIAKLKIENSNIRRQNREYRLDKIPYTEGNVCLFEDSGDMTDMRYFANEAVKKCGGICGVFVGDDTQGYKYIIMSRTVNLKERTAEINAALSARGGGSPQMLTGTCSAKRGDIEKYFE